jgi:adiponectin receptor
MLNPDSKQFIMATTHLKDVPPWMRSDPYIQTGYRRCLHSVYHCLLSLLYLHNEWVNVWSHLFPGVVHTLVLAKESYSFSKQWDEERCVDQIFVWQYITSCILCLLFSVSCIATSPGVTGEELRTSRLVTTP